MDYAIETDSLGKVYTSRFRGRNIKAVSDLTLRVKRGAKFGLLGANGAGKTTVVKMLLSAVAPSSGSARIFGLDAGLAAARISIGYLPENHRFPTYLTAGGMLRFYGALSGLDRSELRRRIPAMLELVGLTGWEDVRIKKFSKGMLQRLGLAQALVHQPQLLILDEPTDGVDPAGRRHIRDVLNGLRDQGVTIFLNSHLLTEVESFCDEVAIIHKGKLALEGQVRDLIAGRGYRVTAQRATANLRENMANLATSVSLRAGTLEAHLLTLEELNQAIDLIRRSGAMVESVSNTVSTLEDVFIRTTQPEPAARQIFEVTP